MWVIINKRHFVIFWTTVHTRVQSHKKQIVRHQLNEKKSEESQTRLGNELIMKIKIDLKGGPDNI